MQLIVKLLAGIVAGILLGWLAPDLVIRLLLSFRVLFGELLFFVIPLLILFFITSGIAALPQQSGRLLGRALGMAYGTTLAAGVFAFSLAALLLPLLTGAASAAPTPEGGGLAPLLALNVPPPFGIMTALALAFIFGIGISAAGADQLRTLSDQGRDVIQWLLLRLIIPLLPFYIASVFAGLTAEGAVAATLRSFVVVLLLVVVMHWVWITLLYLLAGLRTGRSPLQLLRNMLPAYFTALGTMSSAATIPVSLLSNKRNGVRPALADFAVPLFATTHLSGSTITIVACAVAVISIQQGLELPGLLQVLPFIMMLGLVMLAAPGVPGGAVMAALGLLGSMLGFDDAAVALMIALYMAQDSLGTACNVTCDGALTVLLEGGDSSTNQEP